MSTFEDGLYSDGTLAGNPLQGFSSGDEFGTGLCLNFESTRLAVGAPGNTSSTGYVAVYDYDEDNNSWSLHSTIAGPHTDSRFGQSVSMNWDGDRIVIGANAASNVYIYDLDGASWSQSNVIDTSTTSFGECVSIACERNDRICVGAPDVNTIYVYQEGENNSWNLDFSNVGTDIENIVPTSGDNFIKVNDEYLQYGKFVQISAFGNHVVVGAPGTKLLQIDSTNSNSSVTYNSSINFTFGLEGAYQLGHVRVFSCPREWSTGVTQVGSVLRGDSGGVLIDSNWDTARNSMPGYGKVVQIVPDGSTIAISAPEYGVEPAVDGNDKFKGRIYGYNYNTVNQDWEKFTKDIPGDLQNRIGTGLALSYDGSRIAYTSNNQEFLVDIVDWSGTEWYEITTPIKRNDLGYGNNNKAGFFTTLTNGKMSSSSAPLKDEGYVYNYKHTLSSTFQGNNIFGGYIKADAVYVGANNDLPSAKKLLFGGTLGDNEHFATTIESRTYDDSLPSTSTGSELYLTKMPSQGSGGLTVPDRIRFKAHAIVFDRYNPAGYFSENRYGEYVSMTISPHNCIGIGHSNIQDAKNYLDVNGDSLIRSKLVVGDKKFLDIRGYPAATSGTYKNSKSGTFLFYNTRSNVLADSSNVETTIISVFRPESNGIPTNVIYSEDNKAILFSGSSSNVQTRNYDGGVTYLNTYGLWVKPTNISGTYQRILNICDQFKIELNDSNLKLVRGSVSNTYSQTFKNNIWYHLGWEFYKEVDDNITLSNIYVNNTLLFSDANNIPYSTLVNTIVLGDGFNGYIGTPVFTIDTQDNHLPELYEYGPPVEVFSFNGSGVVDGYIKNKNPRFYASNTSTSGSTITTTGNVTLFNETTTNIGNCYDTSTGVFTATIDGTYYFEFKGLLRWVSGDGSCTLTFRKNGTQVSGYGVAFSRVTESLDRDMMSASFMAELVAGDEIQALVSFINSGVDIYHLEGYSHFMGYFMG